MKAAFLAALAALLLAGNAGAIAPRNPQPVAAPVFDGTVMVRFAPGDASTLRTQSLRGLSRMRTSSAVLRGLDATYPLRAAAPALDESALFPEARTYGLDRWFLLTVDPAPGYEAVAAKLRAMPGVELVEPNVVEGSLLVAPNDSLFSRNWGHGNTGTFPSYNLGTLAHDGPNVGTVGFDTNVQGGWSAPAGYGSNATIIAIMDTGVDPGHPDLSQVAGYDYVYNDTSPADSDGHGTGCAGVAAAIANNTKGVAGAAGGCAIMPVRMWVGSGSTTNVALLGCISFAVTHGAKVLSMSFAVTRLQSVADALTAADAAGVLLVAATGNNNGSSIFFPASHPKVIAVGAANPCGGRKRSSSNSAQLNPGVSADSLGVSCDNEVWWGSNWGTAVKDDSAAVDLVAPTILPTTDIQGALGYTSGSYSDDYFNGTSCAAPYVAGVAALLFAQHPTWTPAQVRARLMATAIDLSDAQTPVGWDKYTGYGLVNAGLPDVLPTGYAGWAFPVVPRPTADATFGSVPAPTTLNGDVNSFISIGVANLGESLTGLDVIGIRVDDAQVGGASYNLPPGTGGFLLNAAIPVRGGRHVVGSFADENSDLDESNETNNRNAHQWSFVPVSVPTSTNTVVARVTPPSRTAGRADVPVAETTYDNVDAVRMIGPGFGISNQFWVVGLHASDDATDLDLDLHLPTGSATSNFTPGNQLIASQQGAGKTDWGIMNLGSDPRDNLDAAGLLVAGSGASRFESRLSDDFAPVFGGTTITIPGVAFTSDMMVAVHELQVSAGGAGDISLELNSSAPLHMAVYDPNLLFANRAQASQYSTQLGLVQGLTCTRAQGSRTAIVVYRDRADGIAPLTYSITVRRPTPELVATNASGAVFAPAGVYKDGVGNPNSLPSVLDGNANNTRFYYAYSNLGPAAASGFTARELLDGVDQFTWIPGPLNPGASVAWVSDLRFVRGGRHTMGYINDSANVIDEFNEIDNDWAVTSVWSALPLTMEVPVTRPAPPDPAGGWAQLPAASPRFNNADGFVTPVLQGSGTAGWANFFALAPRVATDDVDLSMYEFVSVGPGNGFTTANGSSTLPAGRIDYIGFDGLAGRAVNLGLLKGGGASTGNVVLHGTRSVRLTSENGTFGPFTLGPDKLVACFDVLLSGPSRQFRLINLTGGANLDLHVFPRHEDDLPFVLPGDALTAEANGDGLDEVLQFGQSGFPWIVVTKRGSGDIAKNATFSIQIGNSTIGTGDDTLPTSVQLAPVVPNPVRGVAAIAFDLPRASTVSLSAYDVVGRHVATLASGSWKAGHHSVSWTPGARLASGVYLLRLEADGVESVRRIVVTK